MALEADLRAILRDELRFAFGAISFFEYGKGGDAGLPDCWVAKAPAWIALELKLGRGVVSKLRPAQVRWHKRSLMMGITTYGASLDAEMEAVRVYRLSLSGRKINETLILEQDPDVFHLAELLNCFE